MTTELKEEAPMTDVLTSHHTIVACRAHPRDHGYVAPSLDVNVQFHRFAPPHAKLQALGSKVYDAFLLA